MSIAEALHEASKGLVVAPAGHGKTHLIASAVINYGNGRQLILTHTHAGVDSIRSKLRRLGSGTKNIHVETIDGFVLRYVSSYPCTCGWTGSIAQVDWSNLLKCGVLLFQNDFVRQIVKSTYSGVYVDEYQDCSLEQHSIVKELIKVVPVRVLGDHLQGIFNFKNNILVDWERDVKGTFDIVGELVTPWRWENAGNPELGRWLSTIRQCLIDRQAVDLSNMPACVRLVKTASSQDVIKGCYSVISRLQDKETLVIIGTPENPHFTHHIAQRLSGSCGVVEPLDSKDLKEMVAKLMEADVYRKAISLLSFAIVCFSGITETSLGPELKALKKNGLPKRKKPTCITGPLMQFIEKNDLRSMITLVESFRAFPESHLYRKELYFAILQTISESLRSDATLTEALVNVRENTRRLGRRLPRKAIARTLLVKGLEFDHAIVLNADKFDSKNLYVALTRAGKTVTIMSPIDVLTPNAN